jgi:hypothetical protein
MRQLLLELMRAALWLKTALFKLWAKIPNWLLGWIGLAITNWITNILTPRWKPWDVLRRRVEQPFSAQAEPINLHFR